MDTLQETNISHSGEKEKHLQNWHFRGYVIVPRRVYCMIFSGISWGYQTISSWPLDLDRVHYSPCRSFSNSRLQESRSNSRNKKSPKTFGFNAYPMAVSFRWLSQTPVVISLKKSDNLMPTKCDFPTFKKKTPRDLHHPNVPRVFLIKSLNAFWWPGGNAGVKNILHKWCFGIWLDVI